MKKVYNKPLICVEAMSLDQPIAANCDPAILDDIEILIDLGYFMDDPSVSCFLNLLPSGGFDYDGDDEADDHNTVCYHSNVRQAFRS